MTGAAEYNDRFLGLIQGSLQQGRGQGRVGSILPSADHFSHKMRKAL